MTERERVRAALAWALGRDRPDPHVQSAFEARLSTPRPNLVPARARRPQPELVELFVDMAKEAEATVARLTESHAVPAAVADFLRLENLPAAVRLAPDPWLQRLDWSSAPLITVSEGPARQDDRVSVTSAFAGIAETGTLMLVSGPTSPTTLNLLPEVHIAVLPSERIVGAYEDGWARLRAASRGILPRTVNLITGPSRSGDIEQTLQLGAHGPRRLHILLIDAPAAA